MITVLKNVTRNEVDSGAVGVVSKEGATKVVTAVLEEDAVAAAIGVDVGATVVTGVVAVVSEAVVVVEVAVEEAVEAVSRAENLGAETIGITMDQENRGETIMTEEVLRVVSIKEILSISQHHPRIKKSLSMINMK